MVVPRLAAALLIALALTAGAASSGAASTSGAPTGLRGFLLRADEPARRAFPRTPAFAWNPVHAAKGYEFVLSTSSTFRENGVVWRCPSAKCPTLETPVAAPGLSLPWITGSPHGLYARVRAVLTDGTRSEWSRAFGFDIVPPRPPTPIASKPGLLRWTPVAGATGYQVWLIDARKFETVYTNVLDEREFYTFHQSPDWIGTVRWRVRALRADSRSDERVNGVPVTQYGAWSPIYRSKNTSPAAGKIRLGATSSDIVSQGRRSDLAHRLMPGFTWAGNLTTDGTRAELYRVYVYTDKQCINRVFTSSVVGSPAYAPRPYGGLSLPINGTELVQARGGYLSDVVTRAVERFSLSYDGQKLTSSESQAAAKPTTTLPVADESGGVSGTQSAPFLAVSAEPDLGAPVSLWDDAWPKGGYYWSGRVGRFGVSSEPSLIAGNDPFASGLSPTGRLTSALRTSSFYQEEVAADQSAAASAAAS